jgi:hypothetical protein
MLPGCGDLRIEIYYDLNLTYKMKKICVYFKIIENFFDILACSGIA